MCLGVQERLRVAAVDVVFSVPARMDLHGARIYTGILLQIQFGVVVIRSAAGDFLQGKF